MYPESLCHWDRPGQSHPGCMVSLINRQVDRKKYEETAINKENKMLTRIAKKGSDKTKQKTKMTDKEK